VNLRAELVDNLGRHSICFQIRLVVKITRARKRERERERERERKRFSQILSENYVFIRENTIQMTVTVSRVPEERRWDESESEIQPEIEK